MVMIEKLIQSVLAVDRLDQPLGVIEKHKAHRNGILHRAFSIFLFRSSGSSFQVLLQQRAHGKYHSGGLWTNTCCSHAEENTPLEITAQDRLKTEMGFSCKLYRAGSFYYKANVDNGMVEHEIDHVFVGLHNPKLIQPNPKEVQDYQWQDVPFLLNLPIEKRGEFTVWFFQAFDLAWKFITLSKEGILKNE